MEILLNSCHTFDYYAFRLRYLVVAYSLTNRTSPGPCPCVRLLIYFPSREKLSVCCRLSMSLYRAACILFLLSSCSRIGKRAVREWMSHSFAFHNGYLIMFQSSVPLCTSANQYVHNGSCADNGYQTENEMGAHHRVYISLRNWWCKYTHFCVADNRPKTNKK